MASIRHSTAQYAARRRSTPPSRRCTPLPAASRRQARCHSTSGSARARMCSRVCPCCVLARTQTCVCWNHACLPSRVGACVRGPCRQGGYAQCQGDDRRARHCFGRESGRGSRARQPVVRDTWLLSTARAVRRLPVSARTDSETTPVSRQPGPGPRV